MLRALLAILVLGSVGLLIPENSYALTPGNLGIFVQIKVQDSNGALVSYLESAKITVTDVAKLNLLLNQNSPVFQKSYLSNGQQKFEVIKATDSFVHQSGTIVSQNMISSSDGKTNKVLVIADHDGYPVVPGDKVTSYWTIIRPAS